MTTLNNRIAEAIADEDLGKIYVTPAELDKIIRMKRCIRVSVYIKTDGYTQESINDGKYYPDVFTKYLDITKKQAKELARNIIKDAEEYSWRADKLIEIRLSSHWLNDGRFYLKF